MINTSAFDLYQKICKERRFELLLLTNCEEMPGNSTMTFEYDGIDNCIHYIDDNMERHYMPWEIADNENKMHNEILECIDTNFAGSLEIADDTDINEIMCFIKNLEVGAPGEPLNGNVPEEVSAELQDAVDYRLLYNLENSLHLYKEELYIKERNNRDKYLDWAKKIDDYLEDNDYCAVLTR